MCKTDIICQPLYINKIFNVIKSRIKHHHKIYHNKGRHSDAFIYILSGSCTYRFEDGCCFTVNEGDILYLAYHAVYSMDVHSEEYHYIFCDFNFDEKSLRKSAVFSLQNPTEAKKLFEKLFRCSNAPSAELHTECMILLYRIYQMVLLSVNRNYIGDPAKNKVAGAKEYIDSHYKDSALSVGLLAEQAEISEVYFRKLFKARHGISPSQYMISVRLEKARELMNYPFLTLEECALQSGFSSSQYFGRIFKKSTGLTPAKYRKIKSNRKGHPS